MISSSERNKILGNSHSFNGVHDDRRSYSQRDTGYYIEYLTCKLARALLDKYGENLAKYIRLNLNIHDICYQPINLIKVEFIAPRLDEKHVMINKMKF